MRFRHQCWIRAIYMRTRYIVACGFVRFICILDTLNPHKVKKTNKHKNARNGLPHTVRRRQMYMHDGGLSATHFNCQYTGEIASHGWDDVWSVRGDPWNMPTAQERSGWQRMIPNRMEASANHDGFYTRCSYCTTRKLLHIADANSQNNSITKHECSHTKVTLLHKNMAIAQQ